MHQYEKWCLQDSHQLNLRSLNTNVLNLQRIRLYVIYPLACIIFMWTLFQWVWLRAWDLPSNIFVNNLDTIMMNTNWIHWCILIWNYCVIFNKIHCWKLTWCNIHNILILDTYLNLGLTRACAFHWVYSVVYGVVTWCRPLHPVTTLEIFCCV